MMNLFINGSENSNEAVRILSKAGLDFTEISIEKSKDEWPQPVLMAPEGEFEGIEEIKVYICYLQNNK